MSHLNQDLIAKKYTPEQLVQELPELFKNQIFIPACKTFVSAGAIANAHRDSQVEVDYKDDYSEVTYADKLLATYLNQALPEIFGDFSVSEEDIEQHPNFNMQTNRCWWLVDPIDGTKGYAQGREDYCHMATLIDQGQPLITFVYQPSKGRIHYAVKGIGVFMVQLDLQAFAYFWDEQQVDLATFNHKVRQAQDQAFNHAKVTYLLPFKFKRVINTDTVNTYEYLVNQGTGNDNINLGATEGYYQYLDKQTQEHLELADQANFYIMQHANAWARFSRRQQELASQGKDHVEVSLDAFEQTVDFWERLLNPSLEITSKSEKTFLSSEFNLNNFRKGFAAWAKGQEAQVRRSYLDEPEAQQLVEQLKQANLALGQQLDTSKSQALNAEFAELDLPNWATKLEHYSRKLPFYLQAYSIAHLDSPEFREKVRFLASIFGKQETLNLQHFAHLNVLAKHQQLDDYQTNSLIEHYVALGKTPVKSHQEAKLRLLPRELQFYARVLIGLTSDLSNYVSEHPNPAFVINQEQKNPAYQTIQLLQGARTNNAFGLFDLPYCKDNFNLVTQHSAGYKASLVFATLDNYRVTNYLLPNAMKIWDVAPSLVFAQNSTSANAIVLNLADVSRVPWEKTNIDFSDENVYPLIMSEDLTTIPFVLDIAGLLYLQLPHLLDFVRPLKALALQNQHFMEHYPENAEQFLSQEQVRELTEAEFAEFGLSAVAKQAWHLFKQQTQN
ncbi:hypothetical protein CKF54_02560 [Psittacicella hinzii]|uniref:Inositol monophosphatase n=1 Tax=Psittacicella hinzii TaxID=2028575 RepID=A0A3A1Y8R6_9GAMM|nr:inositol monophosphatase family protein [Psittacicella hinzii]RIY33598.1 hypothetical protein CKF54_02560 [Psittacicella hinzii]